MKMKHFSVMISKHDLLWKLKSHSVNTTKQKTMLTILLTIV